jgi:hypothetical protein
METAYLPIFASLPKPTAAQEVEWSLAGQKLYAASGVTTAHEGDPPGDLEKKGVMARCRIIDVIVSVHHRPGSAEEVPAGSGATGVSRSAGGRSPRSPPGKTAFTTPCCRRPWRREELEGRADLPRRRG